MGIQERYVLRIVKPSQTDMRQAVLHNKQQKYSSEKDSTLSDRYNNNQFNIVPKRRRHCQSPIGSRQQTAVAI